MRTINFKDITKNLTNLYLSKSDDDLNVTRRRKLSISILVALLVIVLIISPTIAWFVPVNKYGTVNAESSFELKGGSSLEVDQGGDNSNIVSLNNLVLAEATSVDGRNIYFPVTTADSINKNSTKDKLFRQATVGDQNVNYVYKTFTLTANQDRTSIYINNYKIMVGDKIYSSSDINNVDECPVRIAFINDSINTPDVFDPTALAVSSVRNYKAVDTADYVTGKVLSTKETNADPFSLYHYISGSPFVTLSKNDAVELTMVVWLEGAENASSNSSVSENYAGKKFSLEVEFQSNSVSENTITFLDKANLIGSETLVLNYTYNGKEYGVVMSDSSTDGSKDTYSWVASIPNEATDIKFTTHKSDGTLLSTYSHTSSFKVDSEGKPLTSIFTLGGTKQSPACSWVSEINDNTFTTFSLSISDRSTKNWIYDSFANGRNRVYANLSDGTKVYLYCDTADSAVKNGTEYIFKSDKVVVKDASQPQTIDSFVVVDLYGNTIQEIGYPDHLSSIKTNYNYEYIVLSDLRDDGTNIVISKILDEEETTSSTGSTDDGSGDGDIGEEIPGTLPTNNEEDEEENTAGTDGDVGEEIP